jgi:peroxiredoxin
MLSHIRAIGVVVGAAMIGVGIARGAGEVPRYAFEAGKVLTFHEDFSVKYQKGERRSVIDTKTDLVARVIRQNRDGSFRLVFRMMDTTTRRLVEKTSEEKSDALFYADLFPYGRELPMDWTKYGFVPGAVFPPLPKDEKEMSAGWMGATQETVFDCKPVKGGAELEFEAKLLGSVVILANDTHAVKCRFDRAKGFVGRIDDSVRRGGQIKGEGGGTIRLVEVKQMPEGELKKYAEDSDRYFAAANAYLAGMKKAESAETQDVAKITDSALADLKTAVAGISVEELKADGERHVREHGDWVKDLLKSSEGRATRIGKAAPDFETTDVDGKKVRLADLRGKVVVLDFWYRGCAWCARMAPQVNQLAKDFQGKAVAVRGMSIDHDVADSLFVIKQLGIEYPTLRAEGIAEKFGVTGYPILIVIDKNGIVRGIEVGYSATMREDVGKQIEGLLK